MSKYDEYEFRGFYIPKRMMGGLERYLEEGIPPGGFLTAVISNDLEGAVAYADDENLRNIPAYVAFLRNRAPIRSWGSRKNFENWMKRKAEERANG